MPKLTVEMEALPDFKRGVLGLLDERLYDAAEVARYRRFAAKALAVYKAGLTRLDALAPDLAQTLKDNEPVALVPYRSLGLAAAGDPTDEDGNPNGGLFLNVESFSTLSPDEAAFTLGHEALHLTGQDYHGYGQLSDVERNRRRYASDVLVNDELLRRGLPQPHLPTLPTSAMHGLPQGLSFDEVYQRLPEAVPSDPGYYLRRLYPDDYPEGQIMKPLPKPDPEAAT